MCFLLLLAFVTCFVSLFILNVDGIEPKEEQPSSSFPRFLTLPGTGQTKLRGFVAFLGKYEPTISVVLVWSSDVRGRSPS